MNAPPPVFRIPPGWAGAKHSTRPLYLESAELFGHGRRPTGDDWVHVAPLLPPPTRLTVGIGVITLFLTGIEVMLFRDLLGGSSSLSGPVPWVIGVFFAVIDVFFVLAFVNSIQATISRPRWPFTQGIAFGRSGVMIRMQWPIRADVEWEQITEISALLRRPGKTEADPIIPVLHIAAGEQQWSLNPDVLGSTPAAVYTLLFHYWTHPADRAELGTTFGQQRMDVLAGSPPTSIAPWVQRFTGFDGRDAQA